MFGMSLVENISFSKFKQQFNYVELD